jgi:hypothetical protein
MGLSARPVPRPFATLAELGQLVSNILSLTAAEGDLETLIPRIVLEIHRATGFECVGLRLKDGGDYPYYFTQGYDQSFVNKEMSLCSRDGIGELIRDSDGTPYLECMCGKVVVGRTNPRLPVFTPGGSFWSNSTSELLATTTTDEDRQPRMRNRCNEEGYETVALLPLKLGSVICGLLQLNDRRRGQLTPAVVELLEGIAVCIAMVFQLRQAELAAGRRIRLAAGRRAGDLHLGLTGRTAILDRIARELQQRNATDRSIPPALLATLVENLDDLSRADGLVSICAVCKRVRQYQTWHTIERFIADRSQIRFSHGYCPACYESAVRGLDSPGA